MGFSEFDKSDKKTPKSKTPEISQEETDKINNFHKVQRQNDKQAIDIDKIERPVAYMKEGEEKERAKSELFDEIIKKYPTTWE